MSQTASRPHDPGAFQACILIVEDDPLSMKLYNDLVAARGYQVLRATDGAVGLQLAREHHPDLILLDVKLPEVSGIEVTKALKSDPRTKDVPILVITAWPTTERAARLSGCDAFLMKPVPMSELWHAIESLLEMDNTTQKGSLNP